MSSVNISDLDVKTFTTAMELELQQEDVRLQSYVNVQKAHGKKFQAVIKFGEATVTDVTARGKPIEYNTIPNSQRWITGVTRNVGQLVYDMDELTQIVDVKNGYYKSMAAAFARKYDDVIIDALGADARTGVEGNDTTPFLSTQVVPVTTGGSGTPVGNNVAKILAAKELMWMNNVPQNEPMAYALNARQMREMFDQVQATNGDFTRGRPFDKGTLEEFLGIKLVLSNRLVADSNGYIQNYIWTPKGLTVGIWKGIQVTQDRIVFLEDQPTQIYFKQTMGATRTDELRAVKVLNAVS